MKEELNLNSKIDMLSLLAGLALNVFNDFHLRLVAQVTVQDTQNFDSAAIQLKIRNDVYNYTKILHNSIKIPCPECHKLIPFNPDSELVADMVFSWLDIEKDIFELKPPSLEEIKEELIEFAGAHPIDFKNTHSPDCRFAPSGIITLDELIRVFFIVPDIPL